MGRSDEAWNEVGEQFKKLGSMFRDTYEAQQSEGGSKRVSEDEVKDALHTLGESVKAALGTVGETVTDKDVQEEARQTAGSFFDALGATFSDLGAEISRQRDQGDAPGGSSAAESVPVEVPESEE